MEEGEYIRAHYDNSYENMGTPTSWVSYGPEWAQAAMVPFSWYKGKQAEGAIASPLILSGKGIKNFDGFIDRRIDIRDIGPTILTLAGLALPTDIQGRSFAAILNGKIVLPHREDEIFVSDFQGQAFVRKGQWKLLNMTDPMADEHFLLFDISSDPGEKNDVRMRYPMVTEELLKAWHGYVSEMKIVYPSKN